MGLTANTSLKHHALPILLARSFYAAINLPLLLLAACLNAKKSPTPIPCSYQTICKDGRFVITSSHCTTN